MEAKKCKRNPQNPSLRSRPRDLPGPPLTGSEPVGQREGGPELRRLPTSTGLTVSGSRLSRAMAQWSVVRWRAVTRQQRYSSGRALPAIVLLHSRNSPLPHARGR
jgi:hypothetical protein